MVMWPTIPRIVPELEGTLVLDIDCPRVGPGQGRLIFADPDPDPPDPGPTLGRPGSALLDPKVKLFLESRKYI